MKTLRRVLFTLAASTLTAHAGVYLPKPLRAAAPPLS
jgi:hypothetical protein